MKNKNIFLTKFAIIAIAIGLFSPSINVKPEVKANHGYASIPMQVDVSLLNTAEARRGGGGARGGNRNVNRNSNRNVNRNSNRNVNRNTNVNRNVNVNVNHNSRYYGGRHYGYYRGSPLLAFSTGLVIGSVIAASTMPTTCVTTYVNGISYRQCGSSYYQPFYEGDTLVYKVVTTPY